MLFRSVLILVAIFLFANQARADVINPIKFSQVIKDTSFHGDSTLSNTWLNGVDGAEEGYNR